MKSEMRERASPSNTHQEESWGETTLPEHPVAVSAQEALDGYGEETMTVANVQNNAIEWGVNFISRSTRHDALRCDFSVRSAHEEMRHTHRKQ